MECQHTPHTHCSSSFKPLLRPPPRTAESALAHLGEHTLSQEQWMWSGCGQGTSRWIGLTYKVTLCGFTCSFMPNNSHELAKT